MSSVTLRAAPPSVIDAILERKRREVARRERRAAAFAALAADAPPLDPARTLAALRRDDVGTVRIIAEIKRRSPSAGVIRPWARGDVGAIARGYAAAGAAAVSVLADGPGFGGSVLDVRRATRAVPCPILFKEFVVSAVQLDAARAAGASLALLLVRALPAAELAALVCGCEARGLVPLVEAAGVHELDAALASGAPLVGVNARDLGTFQLDLAGAERALERVPQGRVAVLLSGVTTRADLERAVGGRADAVLIGTELMRSADPGARLRDICGGLQD